MGVVWDRLRVKVGVAESNLAAFGDWVTAMAEDTASGTTRQEEAEDDYNPFTDEGTEWVV